MVRVSLLLLLLSGCGLFRPEPVYFPFIPSCDDYIALAQAVVDGRRRGQSRAEQRLLVDENRPYIAIHRSMVESVYDWPRPTDAAAWRVLSREAALAAEARCTNRPAAALRGQYRP